MAGRVSGATSCVAIDLGATAVRVVEVEWARGGGEAATGRVARRGSAPLPFGVWNDLVTNREAFAAAIREAFSAAGITARSVVASLPRRLVTVRFARLPHAPPEQMRGMVAFEAQQHILFSLDEVILDYHVPPDLPSFVANGGDDMQAVLLAAVRRTLVAEVTAIFDRAGLELERLTVSALAVAEHARDALESTAIIDIEPDELDVAVVADGKLLFTRASAVHTENISPDVALRRIAEEVARSLTAYQNEFRSQPLAHVYLVGSSVAGLDPQVIERTLSDVVDMPVSHLTPRLLDSSSRAYAVAVGTALQTRGDSLAPINLYPNERAIQRAQQARRQRGVLAVAAVGALVVAGIYVGMTRLDARAKEWQQTVRVNKELQTITTQLEARERAYKRQQALENDIVAGLARNHPSVDVLAALDNALPRTAAIWLTQFTFEREGMLTLRGESRQESAATDLVIALQKSGAFTDVRLGYLGDTQDTESRGTVESGVPAASAPRTPSPQPPPPTNPAALTPGGQPAPVLPGIPGTAAQPGALTPNTTPPAGAAAPPPAATTAAPGVTTTPGVTARPRTVSAVPLTSFIITCRVNPNAKTLLPKQRALTAAPTKQNGKAASARPSAPDDEIDEGDLLDEMGDEFGNQ